MESSWTSVTGIKWGEHQNTWKINNTVGNNPYMKDKVSREIFLKSPNLKSKCVVHCYSSAKKKMYSTKYIHIYIRKVMYT